MLKTEDLFDLTHTLAASLLQNTLYPWEILDRIGTFVLQLGNTLSESDFEKRGEDIWIAKDAVIYPSNYIKGPCIIGHRTEVRPGAFIRGNVLVGNDCVVGNSTELKNVILFDRVQVPHYNYVGDSILGWKSHMGAGAVTSNVKSDKQPVVIHDGDEQVLTGRMKLGAMVGDLVEVGCHAVLNPGTVVGRESNIYPTSCVRGTVPAHSIWKNDGTVVHKI